MIDFEAFSHGDSVMHRLDPRVRVFFAAFYSFVVALSVKFDVILFSLILSLGLVAAARLPLPAVFRRIRVVFGFLLLIWIVLPLTCEGEALWSWHFFTVTRPGVVLAAQISLKSISMLSAFTALVATMNLSMLGQALSGLMLPDKLVFLLMMTYRYINVLEQERQRLLRAVRIRGFRSGTNIHSYKTYAYLTGMLFVKASQRGRRVYQAMLCRGFSGKVRCLATFNSGGHDKVFGASMLVFIFALILLEHL